MTERGALEDQPLTCGVKKMRALACLNLSDLGDWDCCGLCRGAETLGFLVRHGTDNFVVITAGEYQFKRSSITCHDSFGCIRYRYACDIDIGRNAGGTAKLAEITDESIGEIHCRRVVTTYHIMQLIAPLRQEIA